jgi:RNA polymerase sigma factor (sigma-70 family)
MTLPDRIADGPGVRVSPGPDDAEVIARSRHEPELFAVLFRRHAPTIQRYLSRRIGTDVAEDLLVETFLVAFNGRDRYDRTRPSARPWLYGIAANLLGRHRRAEVRQLRAYARTGVDPVVAAFTDRSDARVTADALKRRLAAGLASLGAAHREALLLVTWGELTYEEAAAALGIPVGTVRSRINRARTALREALGGVDPTAIQEDLR